MSPGAAGSRSEVRLADDQQVLVHDAGRAEPDRQRLRIASESFAQVDAAVRPERRHRLPRARHRARTGMWTPTRRCAPAGRPTSTSTPRLGLRSISPESNVQRFLAGRGIERDDLLRRRVRVQHAVDHQRLRLQAAGFAGIERPGHTQRGDVVAIDLRERRSSACPAPRRRSASPHGRTARARRPAGRTRPRSARHTPRPTMRVTHSGRHVPAHHATVRGQM